ncbi:MAG: histidine kinase [Cyclobacteriaceae bacterium]
MEESKLKINKRIVLYFGLGGLLPAFFFTGEDLYNDQLDLSSTFFYYNLLLNIVISCILTSIISLIVAYSLEGIDRILPWRKSIWKRFAVDLFITPLIAVISIYPFCFVTYEIFGGKDSFQSHVVQNFVIAIVLDLILVAIYEGVYFFKLWKDSLTKTEKLEKEYMSSRFEALKNQINPHFLFNSLNTLSSLVHEDADKSEQFIDEFAKIYRYVLENQENMAVSLKSELEFTHSYLYLQKIRFGESLDSEIKIEASKLDYMIPTLSLQLLIENAIKHNKVTKSDPLKIVIRNEDHYLIVENNLQRRETNENSTGIGLSNLTERYKLMTDQLPEFIVTDNSYIAKIPLIKEI